MYGGENYSAGSLTITKGSINLGASDSYPKGNFSVSDTGELYSVSGNIGGFTINDDGIYNDALELNDTGLHFRAYDDDKDEFYDVGSFAPNFWIKNPDSYGVVTNLTTKGKFMSWGVQKSTTSDEYEFKLFYVAENAKLYSNNNKKLADDTLYFGCPVDFNNQEIRNFNHNFDKDNPLLLYPDSNCKVNYGYTNKVILPTQISTKTGTIVQAVEVFIDHGFVCGINAL